VKAVGVLVAVLLALSPLRGDYTIVLRGGTHYVSPRKPAEKNGAYVFTTTDGTLLSVRKSDVASIRAVSAPKPDRPLEDLGATSSLAGAARSQRETARRIHERPKTMPQKNDAYRPGVGVPYLPGSNDYVVGKTWAPPAGSAVYTGDAPTGVPSSDPPKGAPSADAPTGAPSTDAPTSVPSGDAPKGVPSGDAPTGQPPPPPPPPPS